MGAITPMNQISNPNIPTIKRWSRPTFTPAALQHARPLRIIMNRLVAGDGAPSSPERPEILTGADPALDGPVILFEDVIEILHRSVLAVLLQNTLVFELHNRRRVSGILVGVDDPRRRMVCSAQRFGEKALGRRCIALGREKEVDRRPGGIHGAV